MHFHNFICRWHNFDCAEEAVWKWLTPNFSQFLGPLKQNYIKRISFFHVEWEWNEVILGSMEFAKQCLGSKDGVCFMVHFAGVCVQCTIKEENCAGVIVCILRAATLSFYNVWIFFLQLEVVVQKHGIGKVEDIQIRTYCIAQDFRGYKNFANFMNFDPFAKTFF